MNSSKPTTSPHRTGGTPIDDFSHYGPTDPEQLVDDLIDEYAKQKTYVEEEKPYWLSLRHPRDGEMKWDLWNYFPAAHYERAIDAAIDLYALQIVSDLDVVDETFADKNPELRYLDQDEWSDDGDDLRSDGGGLHQGRRTTSLYYWADPDTDAAITHTGLEQNGAEYAIPFFDTVGDAESYLEQRDDTTDADLDHLSLYRAKVKKQEDAVDVLMDQAGLTDF